MQRAVDGTEGNERVHCIASDGASSSPGGGGALYNQAAIVRTSEYLGRERKRRKEDRERGCVVCMCVRIVKSSCETLRDTDHNSRGPVYLDITLTRENGWQKEMRPCW